MPLVDPAGSTVALGIFALFMAALAVALAIFVDARMGLIIGGIFVGTFSLVGLVLRSQAKMRRRLWAEMVAKSPGLETDPLAVALRAKWRQSWNPLGKPERIRETLTAAGGPDDCGPWIVCVGPMDVPEVGERRFEPYIITAGELLGRKLWFVPVAAALLGVALLQAFHLIPLRGFNVGSFSYFIIMGLVAGGTWVWRTGIRPTYIRAAPGVIEFMEYRIGTRKPIIRSYRMEPGTLVVVSGGPKKKPTPLTIVLSREQHRDTLAIGQMRNKAEAMEHIWWALLSTAPIPTMDDEQLVG